MDRIIVFIALFPFCLLPCFSQQADTFLVAAAIDSASLWINTDRYEEAEQLIATTLSEQRDDLADSPRLLAGLYHKLGVVYYYQ